MTRARREQVSLENTSYYHCISRCVRRAFLCGTDQLSGKSYEHRKDWVIERLRELDRVFTIDLCAYAVMSNHTHLVVRIDKQRADALEEEEVMQRWKRLFRLPQLVERYRKGECTTQVEIQAAQALIAQWRGRLTDLSWYMRSLNEYLARRANAEDGCTGRFWEGRFKTQALLDEAAVLTCMSYVDLNPIRAAIADTPEASDYTSIQQRIRQWHKTHVDDQNEMDSPRPRLMPLVKQHRDAHQHSIGFTLKDYIELVDWAGRQVREDKRGAIAPDTPPVLQRLGLDTDAFLRHMQGKNKQHYPLFFGQLKHIRMACNRLGQHFIKGIYQSRQLYRAGHLMWPVR